MKLAVLAFAAGICLAAHAANPPILVVPARPATLHATIALPRDLDAVGAYQLTTEGDEQQAIPAETTAAWDNAGRPISGERQLLLNVPPGAAGPRRFRLEPASSPAAQPGGFRFAEINDKSLGLWEGQRPVLVYNFGMVSPAGVPADRTRSCYVHPLYGLDSEVLSDDFPKDHYHHRGLFWTWPHISIAGRQYSTWDIRGIAQRFERWLDREAGVQGATLGVENGWYVGAEKVVQERVWFRVYPATGGQRAIDMDLILIPLHRPVTLAGAEGKSYGGLTLRYAPNQATVITTPQGQSKEDLYMTHLPWADLSGQFAVADGTRGAALFIDPHHPDYPPTWLTRHYGVLCIGWPGVEPATFPPGVPIHCRYRVWVHRGAVDPSRVQSAYEDYTVGEQIHWDTGR